MIRSREKTTGQFWDRSVWCKVDTGKLPSVQYRSKENSQAGMCQCLTKTMTATLKDSCGCDVKCYGHAGCDVKCHGYGHAGVKGNEQADWQAKQPPQVACVSEDIICWGAWDISCWHKGKPRTSCHQVSGWERCRKKKCLKIFLQRMRKGHTQSLNQTLELFQRQFGETQDWEWETWWSTCDLFWTQIIIMRYHLELTLKKKHIKLPSHPHPLLPHVIQTKGRQHRNNLPPPPHPNCNTEWGKINYTGVTSPLPPPWCHTDWGKRTQEQPTPIPNCPQCHTDWGKRTQEQPTPQCNTDRGKRTQGPTILKPLLRRKPIWL